MALTKVKINLGTEGNLSGSRSIIQSTKTLVSSSAQLATDISGSFTAASSSFSTRVATMEGSGTAQGVGTSDSPTFNNITATGTVTAQEFHSEFVSASITYTSGSHKFGDTTDDVHSMTGSLNISGSLSVVNDSTTIERVGGSPKLILKNSSSDAKAFIQADHDDIQLGFTSAGTPVDSVKLFVSSSGNLGIGTTSPSDNLHIRDSVPGLRIVDTGNDATAQIGYSDGSGFFLRLPDDANNEDVMIRSYGNTVFNGGNVGIGTTSPDGTLHVHTGTAGSVTANGNADNFVVEINGTGGLSILTPDANHGYIIFGSPTSNEGAILRYKDGDNIFTIGTEDSAGSMVLRTGAGTTALTIDNSQNATFAGDVIVPNKIVHTGDTDTYTSFGTDSYSIYLGGTQAAEFIYNNLYMKVNDRGIVGYNSGASAVQLIKVNSSDKVEINEGSNETLFASTGATTFNGDVTVDGDRYMLTESGTAKGFLGKDDWATSGGSANDISVGSYSGVVKIIGGAGSSSTPNITCSTDKSTTFGGNIITSNESNHTFTASGTDNVAIRRQVWYSSYSSHNFKLSTTDSGTTKYLILSTLGTNGHIDWKISGNRMSQVYASITFHNYADATTRTCYLEWSDDEGQNWNTVDTHGSWGAGTATVSATINTANGSSQTGGSSSGSSTGSNQIIIRARYVGSGGNYIGISNVTIKPTAGHYSFVPVPRGFYDTTVSGITATTKTVQGTWTKIGRQVFIQALVTISGKSGGSGNPYIALPFTPSDVGIGASKVGSNISKNTSISGLSYFGLYGANAQLYANTSSGGYIDYGDWANGEVGFNLTYNAL